MLVARFILQYYHHSRSGVSRRAVRNPDAGQPIQWPSGRPCTRGRLRRSLHASYRRVSAGRIPQPAGQRAGLLHSRSCPCTRCSESSGLCRHWAAWGLRWCAVRRTHSSDRCGSWPSGGPDRGELRCNLADPLNVQLLLVAAVGSLQQIAIDHYFLVDTGVTGSYVVFLIFCRYWIPFSIRLLMPSRQTLLFGKQTKRLLLIRFNQALVWQDWYRDIHTPYR